MKKIKDQYYNSSELEADVRFLARRQEDAGSFSFSEKGRDTGISSNSIVAIVYGLTALKNQEFPADIDDMMSCERMWKKLPKHRKTGDGLAAMKAARKCNYYGKDKK